MKGSYKHSKHYFKRDKTTTQRQKTTTKAHNNYKETMST